MYNYGKNIFGEKIKMCVATSGKIVSINESENTALVDFHGNKVTARTGLVSCKVGDNVLVHAGCILQVLSETEANELEELDRLMGQI